MHEHFTDMLTGRELGGSRELHVAGIGANVPTGGASRTATSAPAAQGGKVSELPSKAELKELAAMVKERKASGPTQDALQGATGGDPAKADGPSIDPATGLVKLGNADEFESLQKQMRDAELEFARAWND